MRKTVEDRSFPAAIDNELHSAQDLLRNRQNYAAMIENIDRLMGEMLDVVEQRGELDNTVVIYSSDHGEMLGDFGRFGKNIWRYASAHVPLVIAGPGVQRNTVSHALVDLTDLTATILEYARCSALPETHGVSLCSLLSGKTTVHRDVVVSSLHPWSMAYDGRYKLVKDGDGELVLFDRSVDPMELCDVAATNQEIVETLRTYLTPNF